MKGAPPLRALELFEELIDRPPDERIAILERETTGDEVLRRAVEEMLEQEAVLDDEFLERAPDAGLGAGVGVGGRLGPYRLLRRLGVGGTSVVFVGCRRGEAPSREVAVKVLRFGFADPVAERRFRQEAVILASLRHRHVASLLDAGTSDQGVSYLVTELVDGVSMTRFCDDRRLGVERRLSIFVSLCRAVQYAHRNLVVHRDLKPGNVLIAEDGEPRLLDFGISKVTDATRSPSEETQTRDRIMTPAYASPEQLRGERATTVSDVYSLGVILYELLVGSRPGVSRGADGTTGRWTRPSVAASLEGGEQRARARSTSVKGLSHRLRGDLDIIVEKALEEEPERRYPTADQLAEDVERVLTNRPIQARRPSLGYRIGRFVRRQPKLSVAALSVVFLFAWILVSQTLHNRRLEVERAAAEEARLEASAARDRAEAVADLLLDSLAAGDPMRSGADRSVRDFLDEAVERVDSELQGQPDLHAAVLDTVGLAFKRLDRFEEALDLTTRALKIRRDHFGTEHHLVARSLGHLAELELLAGQPDRAARLFRQALHVRRASHAPAQESASMAMPDLAEALGDLGYLDEADSALSDVVSGLRREDPSLALGFALGSLARVRLQQDRPEEALDLCAEALPLLRREFGDVHPSVVRNLNNQAFSLMRLGRREEAESRLREVLEIRRKLYRGMDHIRIANTLSDLGKVLQSLGSLDEAEALLAEALEMVDRVTGSHHHATVGILRRLGSVRWDQGDLAGAESSLREAVTSAEKVFGRDHLMTGVSAARLALVLAESGRASEALPWARMGVEATEALPSPHRDRGLAERSLGTVLLALGDNDRARERLESSRLHLEGGGPRGRQDLASVRELLERLDG